MKVAFWATNGVSKFIFYEAHWVFALRYWEVAELLAKQQNGKSCCKQWQLNIINFLVSIILLVNWSVYGYAGYHDNYENATKFLLNLFGDYLPFVFMMTDALLLPNAKLERVEVRMCRWRSFNADKARRRFARDGNM